MVWKAGKTQIRLIEVYPLKFTVSSSLIFVDLWREEKFAVNWGEHGRTGSIKVSFFGILKSLALKRMLKEQGLEKHVDQKDFYFVVLFHFVFSIVQDHTRLRKWAKRDRTNLWQKKYLLEQGRCEARRWLSREQNPIRRQEIQNELYIESDKVCFGNRKLTECVCNGFFSQRGRGDTGVQRWHGLGDAQRERKRFRIGLEVGVSKDTA